MSTDIDVDLGFALHLTTHPDGPLTSRHLALVALRPERLKPGAVLVRNLYFAIDPVPSEATTRRWHVHTAVPAGGLIGRVIASRSAGLPCGTLIAHHGGWATHSVLAPGAQRSRIVSPLTGVPASAHLSLLGPSGLRACAVLVKALSLLPGESLYIGGAADSVGSTAAQLARRLGAAFVVGGVESREEAGVAGANPAFDIVLEHGAARADVPADAPASHGLTGRLDSAMTVTGRRGLAAAWELVRESGRVACLGEGSYDWGRPVTDSPMASSLMTSSLMAPEKNVRVAEVGPIYQLHRHEQFRTWMADQLVTGQLGPGRSADLTFPELADELVETARRGFRSVDVYCLPGG
ncbi:hypothetical protein [Streptomyces sp. NPDC059349]|uniref:hypothetical protein n=1 Tax=Streptomyces sp. NPDC059349 TaxID=3346808 RepID=UPI0036C170D0